MLEKYRESMETMDPAQVRHLWTALSDRTGGALPPPPEGEVAGDELYLRCEEAGLDHADLVMSLAQDVSLLGVLTVESLVGKPIVRAAPNVRATGRTPAAMKQRELRPARVRTDPRVVVSVAPNPKREGSQSWERYKIWTVGATVDDMIVKGLTRGDVAHDESHGFVRLEAPANG